MIRYDVKAVKLVIDSYMAKYETDFVKMAGGDDSNIISYYNSAEKIHWLRGFEIDLLSAEAIITCAKKIETRMTAEDVNAGILNEINKGGGSIFVVNVEEIVDEILINYTVNINRQIENMYNGMPNLMGANHLSLNSRNVKPIKDFIDNVSQFALRGISVFVRQYNTLEGRL